MPPERSEKSSFAPSALKGTAIAEARAIAERARLQAQLAKNRNSKNL